MSKQDKSSPLLAAIFSKLDWTRLSSDMIKSVLLLVESQKQVALDRLANEFRSFLRATDLSEELKKTISGLDINLTINLTATPKNQKTQKKQTKRK